MGAGGGGFLGNLPEIFPEMFVGNFLRKPAIVRTIWLKPVIFEEPFEQVPQVGQRVWARSLGCPTTPESGEDDVERGAAGGGGRHDPHRRSIEAGRDVLRGQLRGREEQGQGHRKDQDVHKPVP